MHKPDAVFDRDFEWGELARFGTDPAPGAMLGIVSGRRRQGKTLLLQELCAATGGFYFCATEATDADSLRLLAHALAEHTGQRVPLACRHGSRPSTPCSDWACPARSRW